MSTDRTRVNERIRISPVRLIGEDGTQMGIVPIEEALEAAQRAGLDLVEVAPNARPPVCRVMDYGKHLYEQQKAAREARKKQHTVDVKELKFRPRTEAHDLEFKLRNARKFLVKGSKVKVTVRYQGAELRHPEQGFQVFDTILEALGDLASVEHRDRRLEGRQITMVLAPAASTTPA